MIYLADADSAIPNLALMRLAAYFAARGRETSLVRPGRRRTIFDRIGDVYGSSIFEFAEKARREIELEWGHVMWGGTGVSTDITLAAIDASVDWDAVAPSYGLYPDFAPSLGFTQRGCRLRCGFCVVPKKEGKARTVSTIAEIWRGAPHPRHIVLLDNDFFGQPRDEWQARVAELRTGRFRVSFCQGINIRLIDEDAAAALASLEYRDNEFQRRRLYTAWDNLRDEAIFRRGVDALARAGVPARHLMVYMLVGYDPRETWDDIWHRFASMTALGCMAYPMVYDRSRADLRAFQRWVIRGLYRAVPWTAFEEPRLTPAVRAEADAAWTRAGLTGESLREMRAAGGGR